MGGHTLTIHAIEGPDGGDLEAPCSCGVLVMSREHVITLDRLAELMDAHVAAAEAATVADPRTVLPAEFYDEPTG